MYMAHRSSNRKVVEYVFRIGIQDLITSGVLEDENGTWTYTGNIPLSTAWLRSPVMHLVATVAPCIEMDSTVSRMMTIRQRIGRTEKIQEYQIVSQAVHFGGRRWFFKCHGCGQLRKHLYIMPESNLCRVCSRLVYQCSRDHRHSLDLLRRSEVLEARSNYLSRNGRPRIAGRKQHDSARIWGEHFDLVETKYNARYPLKQL